MRFALTTCMALGLQVIATVAGAEPQQVAAEPKVINKAPTMDVAPAPTAAVAAPAAAAVVANVAKSEPKLQPALQSETKSSDAPAKPAEPAARATPATTETPASAAAAEATDAKGADAKDVTIAKKLAPPPKPQPNVVISVDLTQQRMSVTEDGVSKYHWPISSGRSGYNTPTGTYRPQWMAKMWRSRKYDDAPMPHSIFFTGGFAIHATFATGMLGRPASHGCVRLSPANAATLFKLVQSRGMDRTRISVFGSPRHGEPAVARRSHDGATRHAAMEQPERRPMQRVTAQQMTQHMMRQRGLPPNMTVRYVQSQPTGLAALFGAKPEPQPVVVMRAPPGSGRGQQNRPLYVYTANGQLVRVR